MLGWLVSDETRHQTGHCISWSGRRGNGYPYPEASGMLLSLLATEAPDSPRVDELINAICRHPQAAAGVGRAGTDYTFDTAIALRGLLGHSLRLSPAQHRLSESWAHLVADRVRDRQPTKSPVIAREPRWSLNFGAHQSKVAGALIAYARRAESSPDARVTEALELLVGNTLALQDHDGRFREHEYSALSYLHAHCYALEGLFMQQAAGIPDLEPAIQKGVRWLARSQLPSGGIQAWHDGQRSYGPIRLDATAQAVRLFLLTDPTEYAASVRRGRRFLLECRDGSGAMPYEPGSPDCNSWATIFSVQALDTGPRSLGPGCGLQLI